MPLYNGTAAGFEVWACRIGVKLGALNSDKGKDDRRQKLIEYGAQVIEGLIGNALLVAMDFGQDRLARLDGVRALVEIMRSTIRESKDDEISELYRTDAMTTSLLCRQRGEPMTRYISRRTGWWFRIKELGSQFSVTGTLLADHLLEKPDRLAPDSLQTKSS